MKEYPVPVVMVSALGEKAEEITFTAFEYGAVDVIQKPEGILSRSMPEIPGEIMRRKLADFVLPLDETAEKIIKIID
jgi:two-component system chemotaxis response regulator CheB